MKWIIGVRRIDLGTDFKFGSEMDKQEILETLEVLMKPSCFGTKDYEIILKKA